jgi:anti-sigma factor RsiW
MEADALHDLTAAYALDALDPEDARRYEAHLAHCERCHDELAELSETASALAYATEASAPPPELRARILEQARAERPNVVPLRQRWLRPVIAVAAVAACAAIGLGLWAVSLSGKLDRREAELADQQRVAQILAAPGSH